MASSMMPDGACALSSAISGEMPKWLSSAHTSMDSTSAPSRRRRLSSSAPGLHCSKASRISAQAMDSQASARNMLPAMLPASTRSPRVPNRVGATMKPMVHRLPAHRVATRMRRRVSIRCTVLPGFRIRAGRTVPALPPRRRRTCRSARGRLARSRTPCSFSGRLHRDRRSGT